MTHAECQMLTMLGKCFLSQAGQLEWLQISLETHKGCNGNFCEYKIKEEVKLAVATQQLQQNLWFEMHIGFVFFSFIYFQSSF